MRSVPESSSTGSHSIAGNDGPHQTYRRLSVIQLPVLSIVGRTLALPFLHLRELVKYGGLAFVLSLVAGLIGLAISRLDLPPSVYRIWLAATHFAIFTPFSVKWSQLSIYGRDPSPGDPAFQYSRTEWKYLLATLAMLLVSALVLYYPFYLLRYGQITFDNRFMTVGALLLLAAFLVIAVVWTRLAFIFPAIAIGKYGGVIAAWNQTTGNLERLAAVIVVAYLPFIIVRKIVQAIVGFQPFGLSMVLPASLDLFLIAWATTAAVGAPALAYKILVLDAAGGETASALPGN
jgi:hypothetical protein